LIKKGTIMSTSQTTIRFHRTRGAFTLIELLLVMVILAILAAVVVPRFTGLSKDASIKAAMTQISNLKTSLSAYEIDNGGFPTTEQGLNALIANPGNLPNWKKYLDVDKVPLDPWGHEYIYRCPGSNGKDYDLFSVGPDGQEGSSDDIGNS
jgi:general secretion pathway protein G